MKYIQNYASPLGKIILAGDEKGLSGLWFEGQKYFGAGLGREYEEKEIPVLALTAKWLDIYFKGEQPDFMPPMAPQGSLFRRTVWERLRQIPYGELTTYKEIASWIAKQQGRSSMSAQAVGGAIGHNPISILIPCHRVIGSDGSLTGYAGGIEKKIKLLELEKCMYRK